MPKKKTISIAEQRQEIKKLKKAGLYSGDLRKPPTKYAKSLIGKFASFLLGEQRIVTVKSMKAAKQLAGTTGLSRGRKVLITAPEKAKISYLPSTNTIKVVSDNTVLKRGAGELEKGKTYYLLKEYGIDRIGTMHEVREKLSLYKGIRRKFLIENLFEGEKVK